MKARRVIGAFVLIALFVSGRVMAQSEPKEQMVIPLSEPGKPFKIVAHVLHSTIRVVSYEGKEVMITVTGEAKQKRESSSNGGMTRIGGNSGGEVTAEENHNTVRISSGFSHFALIEIKVPSTDGAGIDVGTVNGGNIEVENVSGKLEVSNVNGAITLSNVGGSVVANTVNGNVIVTFKSIDPQAPMAFTTLNGKIDVTFPASLKANLKLKAEKGDIFTDFDIEVTKSQPAVSKTSEGNRYRINFDEWIQGKIGGGGPEMMMKTTYGTVLIRKAK